MQDLFSVKDKVALVTGGSRGIGEMIAAGLLANGAKVYISSRKAEVCDAKAAELAGEYGGKCISLPADITDLAGVEQLRDALAQREPCLHILVNNAGAAWGAPLEEFPEQGWDKVMDTNVKGVFFLTQKLLPQLRAAASAEDPARVINIGSVDGLGTPIFDNFSYGPSKAGVHHLTRVLAAHLAKDDILVNAIAPGPFPSRMLGSGVGYDYTDIAASNPRKRIGTPEDIAGTVIYLSSRASAFTSGALITCDGGALVRP